MRGLGGTDPFENPALGRFRERIEVTCGVRVSGKGERQVLGHSKRFNGCQGIPLPACLGSIHRRKPGRLHPPLSRQPVYLVLVDL